MNPFIDPPTAEVIASFTEVPSVFETAPPPTRARAATGWRKGLFYASLLALPAATGLAVARATTPRRGIVSGALTGLALGALRVELARWFTPEPMFEREENVGDLQIRQYAPLVEAYAVVGDVTLESAMDHGYSRLIAYYFGANHRGEVLKRSMPFLTAMQDGQYCVAGVMPPGKTIDELPRPSHPGVELRQLPERRIAALRFRGRFTRDNIAAHERQLLAQIVDGGLAARGSVAFAAYDTPATLPLLRRNELWIELV